jgi:hypothetical protein
MTHHQPAHAAVNNDIFARNKPGAFIAAKKHPVNTSVHTPKMVFSKFVRHFE